MQEQSARVGPVQRGGSALADKELSVWGSPSGGRCGPVTQLPCAKSTRWIKGTYCSAGRQESHGLGSRGVEGSGRRLHSFRSYVTLTRQTLAGLPRSMMSQTGLEAIQTDSSLLGWNPASPGALLRWGAQGQSDPTLYMVLCKLPSLFSRVSSIRELGQFWKAHQWLNWL